MRDARTLSASPAGEQTDLFGNPEPMYRLTRTDAKGDTEHFLVTEAQYQKLQDNPQAQRALNAGRQSGLFGEQDVAQGEIHGPQAGVLSLFRRQIAEGQFDRKDLDKQVADGKITPKDRTALLKQSAQSKLRRDFSGLSLDDALNVWGEMNDQERQQMTPVLRQKAEKELSRYPAGPEKQALRQKIDDAMAPRKSVLPGFLRKFSSPGASSPASK